MTDKFLYLLVDQVTMPRLELLAVLIGERALNFVMNELKLPICNLNSL